jgi:hypothetical protein
MLDFLLLTTNLVPESQTGPENRVVVFYILSEYVVEYNIQANHNKMKKRSKNTLLRSISLIIFFTKFGRSSQSPNLLPFQSAEGPHTLGC